MLRILTATLVICLISMPAYAYIDIAIGSMILQSLIAGFFAFLVMWRGFMAKLKNFFCGNGFRLDIDEESQSAPKD